MPGRWTAVNTICASRLSIGYSSCSAWADEGSYQCSQWADYGSYQCSQWANNGYYACSQYATQGYSSCASWGLFSFLCTSWVWITQQVCVATVWISNNVCQAWYWLANRVCQSWYWVANRVCTQWQWIFHIFCTSANGGPMFLLTDGTVFMNECANGYGTRRWWKLIPDATGSYVNGTWTRMADSINARKYFASAVLADGRLLVCGGEYSDAGGDTGASEIYDPVANSWAPVAPPPGITQIGDSPCCMLADGRFLLGSYNSTTNFLRDPATGNWMPAASKGDSGSEETWVLLRDGNVVVPQCSASPNAELYLTGSGGGGWMADGTLVASIVEAASIETGPGLLLADGRAFFIGSTGNTAVYQPGSGTAPAGTWTAGPAIPMRGNQNQGSKDGPGVLLPSGTTLFPVAPLDGSAGNYLSPCSFYESDAANITRVSDPPNSNCPTYVGRMLIIPTGQAMWAREDDSGVFVYTEFGQPQNSFRPVITSCPANIAAGSTFALSGTQFNGLSQAMSYGDDCTAATNYPIVRIVNLITQRVLYCRTANHAIGNVPSMGVATGNAIVTTNVAVPWGIDRGVSQLFVVANGISSAPQAVNLI